MYRDEILDLYRRPLNQGVIEGASEADGENASCGDSTSVYIEIEDGVVNDVKHETDGCAISTAAVSIATEEVRGMRVEDVLELDRDWMLEKLGIDVSPMRVKCAVLGLKTIQKALK